MSISYDDLSRSDDPLMYGSFPNDLGYGEVLSLSNEHFAKDSKPKIILTGLQKSGKTSIQNVVFHKMLPNETFFLEKTTKILKNDVSSSHFVQFQVWDLPGDIDFEDPNTDTDSIFKDCGAIIYVIDASYNYQESLSKLLGMISKAYSSYPKIEFSVFVHKVEDHSDEQKIDIQRDIQQQILEELMDRKLESVHLSFFLTSIYDRSIFEAFSKVIQSLIPQLPTLENLLDIFISNCRMEKAFLIDVISKIYVATDPSPVDMPTLELCSDMIDVVIDVSSIYGQRDDTDAFINSKEYEPETRSVIKLNNDIVLYLREVDKNLALVCLLRQDKFDKHGLIDYNFRCFKNAILKVIEISKKVNDNVVKEV